jgi:hypothetical protein
MEGGKQALMQISRGNAGERFPPAYALKHRN